MKCFIAIFLRLSMIKLSNVKDYWSTEFDLKYNRIPAGVEFQNRNNYLDFYICRSYALFKYNDRTVVRFLTNLGIQNL